MSNMWFTECSEGRIYVDVFVELDSVQLISWRYRIRACTWQDKAVLQRGRLCDSEKVEAFKIPDCWSNHSTRWRLFSKWLSDPLYCWTWGIRENIVKSLVIHYRIDIMDCKLTMMLQYVTSSWVKKSTNHGRDDSTAQVTHLTTGKLN